MTTLWPILLPSLILLSGVADDLKNRKVHNILSLALLIIVLTSHLLDLGHGWSSGFEGLLWASLIFIPLFALGVLGGGDAKLMLVFGLATSGQVVQTTAFYSLIWGSLLGLVLILLRGDIRSFLLHMFKVKTEKNHDFRIPFTVALYLGWLSALGS